MLDLSRSRFEITMEEQLYSLAYTQASQNGFIIEEGSSLQYIMENNVNKVTPGDGTASKTFSGAALQVYVRPTTFVRVDNLQVALITGTSNYGVGLTKLPTSTPPTSMMAIAAVAVTGQGYAGDYTPSGTAFAFAAGVSLSSGLTAGQYGYLSATNTVIVPAALNGTVIQVTYMYNLTVNEAQLLTGDGVPATLPAQVTGTIGVIRRGLIYTSMFDPSVNWSSNPTITVGANGRFTSGGSGAVVPGIVHEVPSGLVPYLGIMLAAS